METIVVYTEHRYPVGHISYAFYGEHIKALCIMLSKNGLISESRLSTFFKDLTGGLITVSCSTIEKFNREAASRVETASIKESLLNGAVLHVDETLLRCGELLEYWESIPRLSEKSSFDVIIRTYSNENATLYTVNPHKDDEGVKRDAIITDFHGILSHDHDKKYYKYCDNHSICGGHLSRELKGLNELYGIEWADKFRKFYVGMNEYKNRTESCDSDKLKEFEKEYDDLLYEGDIALNGIEENSYIYNQFRPVLNRLKKYKDGYMLFIRNYEAPFTNNQAERDLRHCKVKQKVSGCFRSWAGVVCYTIISSFLSTARKRKRNLFSAIKELFCPLLTSPAKIVTLTYIFKIIIILFSLTFFIGDDIII